MPERGIELRAGLCATCRNARRVESGRGSVFWMCRLSESDRRFAKYPVLPVMRCSGHRPNDPDLPDETRAPDDRAPST